MKKTVSLILSLIMLGFTLNAVAMESKQVTVTLDGNIVQFPDAKPFIDNKDRTLVPIRFVSEALGGVVTWDNDTQTVTIVKGDSTIITTINSAKATLNGMVNTFDTSTRLKEDRTYVPLRFISELLNCDVEWDGENNNVVITSPSAPTAFPEPNLTVHFPKNEYENNALWITLDNLRDFSDCTNYEFLIEFINPSELNTTEIYEGAINGWQTVQLNQWRQIYYPDSPLFVVNKKYLTTRENMKSFNLQDGMTLNFVLKVKRKCSGEIKEYTFSETYKGGN
jgi:hypothetical protein